MRYGENGMRDNNIAWQLLEKVVFPFAATFELHTPDLGFFTGRSI